MQMMKKSRISIKTKLFVVQWQWHNMCALILFESHSLVLFILALNNFIRFFTHPHILRFFCSSFYCMLLFMDFTLPLYKLNKMNWIPCYGRMYVRACVFSIWLRKKRRIKKSLFNVLIHVYTFLFLFFFSFFQITQWILEMAYICGVCSLCYRYVVCCIIPVAQNQVSTDNLSKLLFFRCIRREVRSEEIEFNAIALKMRKTETKQKKKRRSKKKKKSFRFFFSLALSICCCCCFLSASFKHRC